MSKKRDPDMLSQLWTSIQLSARLFFDGRVGCFSKFIPLMIGLYILSPIDFLPDILLPFGVMDDLGAFLVGLQMFIHSAPRSVVEEHRARLSGRRQVNYRQDEPHILEGDYRVQDDYNGYEDYDDTQSNNRAITRWRRR